MWKVLYITYTSVKLGWGGIGKENSLRDIIKQQALNLTLLCWDPGSSTRHALEIEQENHFILIDASLLRSIWGLPERLHSSVDTSHGANHDVFMVSTNPLWLPLTHYPLFPLVTPLVLTMTREIASLLLPVCLKTSNFSYKFM